MWESLMFESLVTSLAVLFNKSVERKMGIMLGVVEIPIIMKEVFVITAELFDSQALRDGQREKGMQLEQSEKQGTLL